MTAPVKMPFGKRDSTVVHITEVGNGLDSNCTCLSCESPLVAKQGRRNRWHFAHASDNDCRGEGVLHKGLVRSLSQPDLTITLENGWRLDVKDVALEHWDHRTQRRYDGYAASVTPSLGNQGVSDLGISGPCALEVCVKNPKDGYFIASMNAYGLLAFELPVKTSGLHDHLWESSWLEIPRMHPWTILYCNRQLHSKCNASGCRVRVANSGVSYCPSCKPDFVCGCGNLKSRDKRKCAECLLCPECGVGEVPYRCRMCTSCSEQRRLERYEAWDGRTAGDGGDWSDWRDNHDY